MSCICGIEGAGVCLACEPCPRCEARACRCMLVETVPDLLAALDAYVYYADDREPLDALGEAELQRDVLRRLLLGMPVDQIERANKIIVDIYADYRAVDNDV